MTEYEIAQDDYYGVMVTMEDGSTRDMENIDIVERYIKFKDTRIKELEATWVSVEDSPHPDPRLPHYDGDYILRIQQIGGDDWFYTTTKCEDGVMDTMISERNITHWMPIPQVISDE